MCSAKKKVQRKYLNSIGKESYFFDVDKEKAIYGYLAHYQLKKNEINLLDENLKFNSYKQWKTYIVTKYDCYDIEGLQEFYRFLKLKKRTVKFNISYWEIFIPILVTLCFTLIFDKPLESIINMDFDFLIEFIGNLCTYIIASVVQDGCIISLVFICMWFIKTIIVPMPQNDLEKYLYVDYMEIVKEIIKEKEKSIGSEKYVEDS